MFVFKQLMKFWAVSHVGFRVTSQSQHQITFRTVKLQKEKPVAGLSSLQKVRWIRFRSSFCRRFQFSLVFRMQLGIVVTLRSADGAD